MKHNPVEEPIDIKIGAKTYHLVCTFEAIAEAERLLDRSLIFGLRQKDIARPTIDTVRALFYGQTREHHGELTFGEVKNLITRRNFSDIAGRVVAAWSAAMDEPEAEDPANPTPPAS